MDTPSPLDATAAARYRTLLEINNAVISSLTREALFHAIAQALRGVVSFERAAIFLHDPVKDVLRLFVLVFTMSRDRSSIAGTRESEGRTDTIQMWRISGLS